MAKWPLREQPRGGDNVNVPQQRRQHRLRCTGCGATIQRADPNAADQVRHALDSVNALR